MNETQKPTDKKPINTNYSHLDARMFVNRLFQIEIRPREPIEFQQRRTKNDCMLSVYNNLNNLLDRYLSMADDDSNLSEHIKLLNEFKETEQLIQDEEIALSAQSQKSWLLYIPGLCLVGILLFLIITFRQSI